MLWMLLVHVYRERIEEILDKILAKKANSQLPAATKMITVLYLETLLCVLCNI